MPRTRHEMGNQQKREEIMVAARLLIMSDGYEATSMSRLAKAAGVAPNTLYWYFKDKDELLIAILDELVNDALNEYLTLQNPTLDEQILWLLNQFDAVPSLINTVHSRMTHSETIKQWHERFHFMVESLVVNQLMLNGLEQDEAQMAARVTLFVIEGLLSHHAGHPAERKSIAKFLVSRIQQR